MRMLHPSVQEAAEDLWQSGDVAALSRRELEAALGSGAREAGLLVALYAPWCPFCQAMEGPYAELAAQLAGSGMGVAKFRADTEREFAAAAFGLKTFPTIVLLPAGQGAGQFVAYPSEKRDAETLGMWVRALTGKP